MKAVVAGATTYTDMAALSELKRQARNSSADATGAATRQFEALFVEMMLKSMRQASPSSELLNGAQTQMFRELHDKQLAQSLATTGKLGFAKVLAGQLQHTKPEANTTTAPRVQKAYPLHRPAKSIPIAPQRQLRALEPRAASPVVMQSPASKISSPAEFIEKMRPHAEAAASELGVAPEVLLAQSALESGWGKRIMHRPGGNSSHNLFGIKSSGGWQGPQINTSSIEYSAGSPRRTAASFRAYDSYAQSFNDYVNFIKHNPRYAQALQHANDPHAYLSSLQAAGYATDPNYATKVQRLMQHDAIRSSSMVASNNPPINRV